MSVDRLLTGSDVKAVFAEEILLQRGQVTSVYEDDSRLFLRSVLPAVEEASPGDRIQGGVVLKMLGGELWLNPYLFRIVCRNGAIFAHSVDSHHVEDLADLPIERAIGKVRAAVQACCDVDVFQRAARMTRDATRRIVDHDIQIMHFVERLAPEQRGPILAMFLSRFGAKQERTAFALMNAVTSIARDTRDPQTKWDLEELGGAIAARLIPRPPTLRPGARRQRSRHELIRV